MLIVSTLLTGTKYRIATCAHGAYVSFLWKVGWSRAHHFANLEDAQEYVKALNYTKENAPS